MLNCDLRFAICDVYDAALLVAGSCWLVRVMMFDEGSGYVRNVP